MNRANKPKIKDLKTNQNNDAEAATLVKNRMRELGFEYQLNGRTLEIKLLHDRKLVVRLSDNPAAVERMMVRLLQYAEAVNSVSSEYRITSRTHTTADVQTPDNHIAKPAATEIPFEMTIEEIIVRLSKNRELSRPTEGLTMAEVAQLCDEMPAYIDAIDSVPYNFRIRSVLPGDRWTTES